MLQPLLRALPVAVAVLAGLTALAPPPVADAAPAVDRSAQPNLETTELRTADAAMATDTHSVPTSGVGVGAGFGMGERDIEPFVLVAASWTQTEAPSTHPQIRVRDERGWSHWMELQEGDAQATSQPSDRTSEPIWVGAADAYELAAPGLDNLRIHLVRPDATAGATATVGSTGEGSAEAGGSLDAASTGTAPPMRSRAEWGARPATRLWDAVPEVRAAMIHHTATTNSYTAAQVPAMLRAIQALHMDANGWIDIGYNFVVDRFGTTWEGRGGGTNLAIAGTHTGGYNYGSVGIAVLGDFTASSASIPVMLAVADVAAWKLWLSGSDPAVPVLLWPFTDQTYPAGVAIPFPRVVGHGDLNQTGCPGRIRLALPQIRALVIQRYQWRAGSGHVVEVPSPIAPPQGATAHRGDFDGDGRDDIMWYAPGASSAQIWPGTEVGFGSPRTEAVRRGLQPLVGDLDGDGTDDVLWWSDGETTVGEIWMMSRGGAVGRTALGAVPSTYLPTLFDPDADGDDDIMWYERATGATWSWTSFGPAGYRGRWLAPFAGRNLVTADLDGDSRDDLVWFDGGANEVWRFGDAFGWIVSYHDLTGSPSITVGDTDGEGADELLVAANGVVELRSGLGLQRGPTLPVRPGSVLITADTDGGGSDEMWMRWPDGLVSRWIVGNSGFVWARSIPGPAGLIPTRLDSGGDGRHDLLWSDPANASTKLWLGN